MSFDIKKFYYGDIPDDNKHAAINNQPPSAEWPLWEIFIRSRQGLDHKHMGSLHASDAQMAIENARDVYTRRQEGISIWAVESQHIHASNPDESKSMFDPANDKIYRYPTFYNLPDELQQM
jgi:ring-1,2-phenylacetyl-CoA epoxidase subunit PaaB